MPELLHETAHFAKPWQQQLAQSFTTLDTLCDYLDLETSDLPVSIEAMQQFPLRVPLSFASSMEKANPFDPLLRQVLPIYAELQDHPDYHNDPVGDLAAATQIGLLHKYQGRVLLINTGSCAINCRYCFRRNFPYSELQLSKQQEAAVIQTIQKDTSIHEVILSGGDPLLLSDERLARLLIQIDSIAHVKRIRIHSRLPVVLPARITESFITTLKQNSKQIVLVLHCNHGNELNERVGIACQRLKQHDITLLNQSVLLKDVNDTAPVLCELSERLFQYGVLPYYLHLLDKATGTAHFAVSKNQALSLIADVQARLSGYLVPKLVTEIAGATSKQYVIA
jgi:L-lysine 2,3-aminomutase